MKTSTILIAVTTVLTQLLLLSSLPGVEAFHMVMMARRGKGGLKQDLEDGPSSSSIRNNGKKSAKSLNRGKGQEITGVTLPANGNMKGWEFGEGFVMVCANVDDNLYALQGQCPRCAFDLWKGDLIVDDPGFEDLPRVACPTCATTFGMTKGDSGPPLKRRGLAGFVGGLTKQATADASLNDATAYIITRDEEGRVFCRER